MIKKSGYLLLAATSYGVLESIMLGYSYYIIFATVMFFILASDILIFNLTDSKDLYNVSVKRTVSSNSGRKWHSMPVELSFRNNSRRKVVFHYYDTLSDVFSSEGYFEGTVTLNPGEEISREYSISSNAIGKYNVGPVIMYTEDPMKLCLAEVKLTRIDEFKIAPAISEIHTQRSERLSNFIFTQGLHYSRTIGQGYDFFGLRQYTDSDDFKYVAWSKYGLVNGEDLYIKQMEEERQLDVVFLIDYGIGVNQGTLKKRMYDRIINVVINASYSILKNHDGVGFSIDSSKHDYFIKPAKSEKSVREFEKVVSEIRPMGDFSLAESLKKIEKNVKKNALIFVISPFSYPEQFNRGQNYKTGKHVYVFMVDPYDFVDKKDDEAYRKLMESAGIKERRKLNSISQFFRSVGIKANISRERDLLMRIMTEYKYGKMRNEGA